MDQSKETNPQVKQAKPEAAKPKPQKRLLKNGDHVIQIKRILGLVLSQAKDISPELRDCLKAAQAQAWEDFKKEQEAQMALL